MCCWGRRRDFPKAESLGVSSRCPTLAGARGDGAAAGVSPQGSWLQLLRPHLTSGPGPREQPGISLPAVRGKLSVIWNGGVCGLWQRGTALPAVAGPARRWTAAWPCCPDVSDPGSHGRAQRGRRNSWLVLKLGERVTKLGTSLQWWVCPSACAQGLVQGAPTSGGCTVRLSVCLPACRGNRKKTSPTWGSSSSFMLYFWSLSSERGMSSWLF